MCVLFFVISVFGEPRVDPLVLISSQGLVRGHKATDGDYSMFLGVPYAQIDPEDPFGVSIMFKAKNLALTPRRRMLPAVQC